MSVRLLGEWVAGTALIVIMCAAWASHEASVQKDAQIAQLNGYVAGYQKAQKTELQIHVVQDKLNVQLHEAQARIVKDDPKCADPQPYVDDFKSGIVGLRGALKSGDSAEPAGTGSQP